MIPSIPFLRLHQQQVSQSQFTEPAEVVRWMGAMQAQDFPNARWAVGLRLPWSTDATVAAAVDAGNIVRTHVLRPTWHLVPAEDARWMLDLTAPRIRAAMSSLDKQAGIDADVLQRSRRIMEAALREGQHLTRKELVAAHEAAGMPINSSQATHLVIHAELDKLVCNGAMRGKENTYALMDIRVPAARPVSKEEALAILAQRYFQSHAPASLHDFHWWSGLPMGEARAGVESLPPDFERAQIGGQDYWLPTNASAPNIPNQSVYLLPAFDEFMVAYKDRSASLEEDFKGEAITGNGIFKPIIVKGGKVVGIWNKVPKKASLQVAKTYFGEALPDDDPLLMEQEARIVRFLMNEPSNKH